MLPILSTLNSRGWPRP